jgi:hypothetical protein
MYAWVTNCNLINITNIYKFAIIHVVQEVFSQQSYQVTGWTTQEPCFKARINGTDIFDIYKVSKLALKHIILPI